MGDMADYYASHGLFLDDPDPSEEDYAEMDRRIAMGMSKLPSKLKETKATEDRVKANKFYVGSPRALENNWGHRTLAKAVQHAEQVLDEQDMDETFVVQIIRVVRRRRSPAEVVKV